MTQAKYAKVVGAWKAISGEFAKVAGVWKPVTTNWAKVTAWKGIPFAKYIFACEQFSDYLYGLDDVPADLTGWPKFGTVLYDPVDVATDSDGNSYWAGENAGGTGGIVLKIGINGAIAWTYTGHAAPCSSICVDADGNVYTGDTTGVVKKLNSSGVVQWTKTLGVNYAVYALAVDYSAGRLYAGTGWMYDAVYSILTLNGNATRIYTSPYGDVAGIGIDEGSPTSLYIGTTDGYLLKISTGGYVYWGSGGPISTAVYNVRVGHDGYGYCATGPGGGLYKFTLSTGGSVWTPGIYIPPGSGMCAIGCSVDQFGNVYGTWFKIGTSIYNVIRKVNSSGALVWSWQPYTSAQWRGVAVSRGIKAAGF